MFYALMPPEHETDRIRLFPTIDAAVSQDRDGRPIYEVAVDFDPDDRLVVPITVDAQVVDPEWTTRAEVHGDGSITAKGKIPGELYVGCVFARR
jgi:hypothetical protein